MLSIIARHVSCAVTPRVSRRGNRNMEKAYQVPNEAQQLLAILEAPLAYIQSLDASPDELFWVEGRVPGLDEQRAEDDFEHVGPAERLLRGLQGGRRGRRGHGGYIGGHWVW